MILEALRMVLIDDSSVSSLIGRRVDYVTRTQGQSMPSVVLTAVSTVPQNHLAGAPTLDSCRVQLDAYDSTYTGVRALATACRSALEAAGYVLESEIDNFEPDVSEFRITQDYLAWN